MMTTKGGIDVQKKWAEEKVLQVDGIIFGSGDIILMNCISLLNPKSGRSSISVSPLARSTVASVLEFDPDPWTYVTILSTFDWPAKGRRLFCGEGSMGNEGFVAVVDASSGQVQWIAFSTCSNPFLRVFATDENVVAENNHGHLWIFPYAFPERVRVLVDAVEETVPSKQS